MYLSKHQTDGGPRWAIDGRFLPSKFSLSFLLSMDHSSSLATLAALERGEPVGDAPLLAPIDPYQEVWACGVTYRRSRDARKAESTAADVYERVYEAERPEIFFKSLGWRASGSNQAIRIRRDSSWDVPEPELTLVVNAVGEIVGYCAGNDMSSRSIEGENPLYLPQAKTYRGSCAIGPGIMLATQPFPQDCGISVKIQRGYQMMFEAETDISHMKRKPAELVEWLSRELDFPEGVFLMTGTALVPDEQFTLFEGDVVTVRVGDLTLENQVT